MRRRKPSLERLAVSNPEARAKVGLVLSVLSGEKPVGEACRETGLRPSAYYKLEERLVGAMVAAAALPPGRRANPIAEAGRLSDQTEMLRTEHRRLASLVRISRKLFRETARKGPGRPKKPIPEGAPPTEARRPGRPPAGPPPAAT